MAPNPTAQSTPAALKSGVATVALFELLNAVVGVFLQCPAVQPRDKQDLVTLLDNSAKSAGLTRSQGKWIPAETLTPVNHGPTE